MTRDDSTTTQSLGRRGEGGADVVRALLVFSDGEPILHRLPDVREVTVGRGADVTVRIDHRSLSRRHAKIGLDAHVTVEDLGSSNGTFVGGVRLAAGQAAIVAPGTPIEVGQIVIIVHVGSGPTPTILSESDGDARGKAVERLVDRVAGSSLSVLLAGETGTGKSLLARRLHERSSRAAGPFVTLAPSAIVRATGDPSELYSARGGTLVLDDVVEVPPPAQSEVARLIDSLGDEVRVVATTQRDALVALDERRFAPALYQRVAGVTIVVPPLRARVREIAALAHVFAAEAAKRAGRATPVIAPDAVIALERHRWPGNVRELRAVAERAVVLGSGRVITASHLPGVGERSPGTPAMGVPLVSGAEPARGGALREARDEAEYQRIVEALRACGGNQTQAARSLGISRGTLIARLDRFRVPRPRK